MKLQKLQAKENLHKKALPAGSREKVRETSLGGSLRFPDAGIRYQRFFKTDRL